LDLTSCAVTTLAGQSAGSADGVGTSAQFNLPTRLWGDGTNLFIADQSNCNVRKLSIATGAVTTVAGLAGNCGAADGLGSDARFSRTVGIAGDGTTLFVADYDNNTIRKLSVPAAQLVKVSGDGQTGAAGTALAGSLVVEARTAA